MTAEGFDDAVTSLRGRVPYKPFVIVLKGGDQYEIDHPRVFVPRESGVAVFLSPGGMPIWFDHESVLRVVDSPASQIA
jgi:hypothetical protein